MSRKRPTATLGTVHTVPTSIDPTGVKDVTAQVLDFIANYVPDGDTVQFQPSGRYRVDGPLHLPSRAHLLIAGNFATFLRAFRTLVETPIWELWLGTDIRLRNMTLSSVGAGTFDSAVEHNHGISVRGTDGYTVHGVTFDGCEGDSVYLGVGSGGAKAHAGTIYDIRSRRAGRNNISPVHMDQVEVYGTAPGSCILGDAGFAAFDVEPNTGGSASRVHVHDVTMGRGGRLAGTPGAAIGVISNNGDAIADITFERITFTGPAWLYTEPGAYRPQRVALLDSVGTHGGGVDVANIDGLTVTGNRVDGVLPPFVRPKGCTGVVASPNTINGVAA